MSGSRLALCISRFSSAVTKLLGLLGLLGPCGHRACPAWSGLDDHVTKRIQNWFMFEWRLPNQGCPQFQANQPRWLDALWIVHSWLMTNSNNSNNCFVFRGLRFVCSEYLSLLLRPCSQLIFQTGRLQIKDCMFRGFIETSSWDLSSRCLHRISGQLILN
jgi:hypothetical protein